MNKGLFYALMAAMLNASVGVLSGGAFAVGVSPAGTAFYKCLFALLALTVVILILPQQRRQCVQLGRSAHWIALLALVGIFVLYYFETTAYETAAVGIVVFTLQGVSTLTVFLGSYFILKMKQRPMEWAGMSLALLGLVIFFSKSGELFSISTGVLLAAIAGIGYGLFMVLNKKIILPIQGVPLLWWLLLFGCLFLFIPFYREGSYVVPVEGWLYIACLGVLGTIGGFYFTIKALMYLAASRVQLCELCEPIFASLLGLIFLKQWLSVGDIIGAVLIFSSIYMLNRRKEVIDKQAVEKVDEVKVVNCS